MGLRLSNPASATIGTETLGKLAADTSIIGLGTSYTDITGNPLSISPAIGVRPVEISVLMTVLVGGSGGILSVDIYDVTGAAVLGEAQAMTAAGGAFVTVTVKATVNPGAGVRTYRPRLKLTTGSANVTVKGASAGYTASIKAINR